ADLVVEPGVVPAGLERDAHVPELFLVPLEHAVEGLVGGALGVLGHGGADLLLGQELAGRQGADEEVEQPLRLVRGHVPRTYRSPSGPRFSKTITLGGSPALHAQRTSRRSTTKMRVS